MRINGPYLGVLFVSASLMPLWLGGCVRTLPVADASLSDRATEAAGWIDGGRDLSGVTDGMLDLASRTDGRPDGLPWADGPGGDLSLDGGGIAPAPWAQSFGSIAADNGNAVAVDSAGNVYLSGGFQDTVSFGGAPLTSGGGYDIFLASFDAGGNHRWSKGWGSSGEESGRALAVDGAGNVFLTGDYQGALDFGGGTLVNNGASDVFVASFDGSGNHRWSMGFGGGNGEVGQGLAVDSGGNVVVTGDFSSKSMLVGTSFNLENGGSQDIFIVSLGGNGSPLWAKAFGGANVDSGSAVVVDSGGNLYLTGHFQSALSLGGAVLASNGAQDAFVASFDGSGAYRCAGSFGGTSSEHGLGIAVDAAGNIYVAGEFTSSTVTFGGDTVTNNGGTDLFLASFDPFGGPRWVKAAGAASSDRATAAATDSSGNVYFAGEFASSSIDLGGGSIAGPGGSDIFVVSYDAQGTYRWAQGYGGSSGDFARALAIDGGGGLHLAGYFASADLDFGSGMPPLAAVGAYDIFVARLIP